MSDQTRLKSISQIGEVTYSDSLQINLAGFFQWGLLGVGGFTNIRVPTSGVYGGDLHRLRPVKDPAYTDGQVWEGFRQDWVWESGVDYPQQPIRVSGVYVDGNFQPGTGVGTYAHHVNYPLGRVVFSSAISPSSAVTTEYSYRYCGLSTASVPWWRQFQFGSLRPDFTFLQAASGGYAILGQNRIQLPHVVVEATTQTTRQGYEIGNVTATVRQEVLFHIFSETPWDRSKLHDIITSQWNKRLVAYDVNRLLAASGFPLNSAGTPTGGANMYPDLVKPSGAGGYGYQQLRLVKMAGTDQPPLGGLFYASVRATIEAELA